MEGSRRIRREAIEKYNFTKGVGWLFTPQSGSGTHARTGGRTGGREGPHESGSDKVPRATTYRRPSALSDPNPSAPSWLSLARSLAWVTVLIESAHARAYETGGSSHCGCGG